MQVLKKTLALAAVVSAAGCYTYIPTELSTVPAGQEVRVYMSRLALAALPEDIPANDLYLRGSLTAQADDSLTIRVPITSRQQGLSVSEIRQDVRVPTAEIVAVQRREFSTGRTALAIGGAAVGAGAIIALIFEAVGGGGPGDPPGDDLSRVPLFSIPLR